MENLAVSLLLTVICINFVSMSQWSKMFTFPLFLQYLFDQTSQWVNIQKIKFYLTHKKTKTAEKQATG